MNRKVDLLSYLPPFLQDFKENKETLEAMDPEFTLAWNGADQVLKNEFIETADEFGISRFEGILNILPSKQDTLEVRRRRVLFRWFNRFPQTLRVFLERLAEICRNSDYTVTKNFLEYRMDITTNLEEAGQAEELDRLIEEMIPCNMVIISANHLPCETEEKLYAAGAVCFVEQIIIADEGIVTKIIPCEISGSVYGAGAAGYMEHIEISDMIAE